MSTEPITTGPHHRMPAAFSALIAILAVLLSCLVGAPAYAAAGSDTLGPGERLNPEQRITSQNGAYFALMQSDGNFVLYGGARGVRWASDTNGNAGPSFVIMQTDGNMVVYGAGEPKWWTRTSTPTGAARLVVQNDGNMVIYDGGVALWETGTGGETPPPPPGPETLSPGQQLTKGGRITSPNKQYFATIQDDGNFVIYGPSGWTWSTKTNGVGSSAFVRMQTDGNLVVYTGSTWRWQSATKSSTGAARLVMQDDGNLVILDGTTALWSAKNSAGVLAPPPAPAPPAPGSLADSIVAIATAQLNDGNRNHEFPAGSNCNVYATELRSGSTGCANGMRYEPWCADFARWVWGHAGANVSGLNGAAASFSRVAGWRATNSLSSAQVGDAVVFKLVGGSASHVGIVVARNANGSLTMISGNQGDAVRRTTVPASQVSGFTTPRR